MCRLAALRDPVPTRATRGVRGDQALRRKPVRVQGTLIDAATAGRAMQSLSRLPAAATQIPWIAHRARVRDWAPLARAVRRETGTLTLTRQVMFWSIVCNEPWARWNPKRTAAASRGSYLAKATAIDVRLFSSVCSAVPRVAQPAWSTRRVRSDKSVLFVVGGTDPQDPVSNVARATHELPNSRTVVVPAGGHGSVQLGCMPRVAQGFVENGTAAGLDARCAFRYVPPPFVLR
jgi:pimeloyl-ACP methyl ester carboxylesterase